MARLNRTNRHFVKLDSQFEITTTIVRNAGKFIDLKTNERFLLIAVSGTIGGNSTEIKRNISSYSKQLGAGRVTVRNAWDQLVENGYIRGTFNENGEENFYLVLERISGIATGEIVPSKVPSRPLRGAAKASVDAQVTKVEKAFAEQHPDSNIIDFPSHQTN